MFNSPTRRGFSLFSRVISKKGDFILTKVKIQDGDSETLADVKNDGTDNALVVVMNIIPDMDIGDISKGTQTNDVKVTLNGEVVVVSATDLDIRDLTSVSDSVSAVGEIAHDAVDSGNPIKMGAVATDWDPDTEGDQGPTAVAAGDRVELTADLKGRLVERVQAKFELLTGLDDIYNGTPSTNTSATIECFDYRYCTLGFDLVSSGTPTDFTIEVQVSADGTNWHKLTNDALGNIIYSDASVDSEVFEAIPFAISARKIRVKMTGTGLGASNTFTVDNTVLMLRN